MPQPKGLDPFAFCADGGPSGVLLIHGYTGSVAETRPMGEYLAARGLTVRCPLLTGHGTTPQELTRIRWRTWIYDVETALWELWHSCSTVFVGGLSLGSLLTLWLGSQHGGIDGLIVMAPAIQFRNRAAPLTLALRYLIKNDPFASLNDNDLVDPEATNRLWCYDNLPLWGAAETYLLQRNVRQALPSIEQPIVIFHGRHDAQVPRRAAQTLYDGIGSSDKTLIWLDHSGHNLLVDGERESVWAKSYEWMASRARES